MAKLSGSWFHLLRYVSTRHFSRIWTMKLIEQNKIVDEYRRFHDLIRAEFDFSTAASIMTPSAVQSLLVGGQA
jgi:hypothetical protein